ncbi:penicillin-binding protein 1A [Bacteroidota bacterium]|nr:penicillin-binding protein 1A [Bacteroidota bacterium]
MSKKKNSYRKYIRIFWFFTGGILLSIILLITLTAFGLFGDMPTFEELENPKSSLATEVYSSDGVLLGKYYFQNRSESSFDEIPASLKNALIATEDIRFYEHSGIDYWGTVGGVVSTLLGDKRGASTISQQLALNLFSSREKNPWKRMTQKLKEWIIAVKLERRYTKEEIINLYFNTVAFSDNSYGIKSAARTYFSKDPDSLKVEEAAVLVGMLKGNTLYNPRRNPKKSTERRNTVLDQMEKYGFLTKAQLDTAKKYPIKLNYQSPDHNEGVATYFREHLRQDMMKWCSENKKSTGEFFNLYKDGLKVYTTINFKMQVYAEAAVQKHMAELQKQFYDSYKGSAPWGKDDKFISDAMKQCDRYIRMRQANISIDSIKKSFHTPQAMTVFSYRGDVDTVMTPYDSIKYYKYFLHTGFMVTNPHTGEILSWVGGISHRYFKYDHVNIHAKRQVGSTIKPILYTTAIENGYSPCFEVPNVKVVFENFNNWSPDNSDNKYGGIYTLYKGLANSVNCISAYLMKQIGPQPMIDMARRMGIESKMDPYPSLCLGVPDISVYEMVGAYGTFANKGIYNRPYYIQRICDSRGNVLQEFTTKKTEVINEGVAYVMVRMLENVVNAGTGQRLRGKYGITGEVGGKTGTTQNNTDGWFMSITPQLTGGVWVGGDDRIIRFRSIFYGQGASMALPTWGYFLKSVYADKSLGISPDATFEAPASGVGIEIDCDKYKQHGEDKKHVIFGEQYN